jgi:hypothetical protein
LLLRDPIGIACEQPDDVPRRVDVVVAADADRGRRRCEKGKKRKSRFPVNRL